MSETPPDDLTLLAHAGNHPADNHGIINPPVYHASTVLFPTVAAFEASLEDRYSHVHYGRYGTPTTFALEEAVAALEGGEKAFALPSGLAAINVALMSFLDGGDHILVSDSVYAPVRTLCDRLLSRFGIAATYYDPLIGAGIADLRGPGRARHRRRGPCRRRAGGARQYLGDAAVPEAAAPRRRHRHPRRDQIHRRPFRRDARDHRRGAAALAGDEELRSCH